MNKINETNSYPVTTTHAPKTGNLNNTNSQLPHRTHTKSISCSSISLSLFNQNLALNYNNNNINNLKNFNPLNYVANYNVNQINNQFNNININNNNNSNKAIYTDNNNNNNNDNKNQSINTPKSTADELNDLFITHF